MYFFEIGLYTVDEEKGKWRWRKRWRVEEENRSWNKVLMQKTYLVAYETTNLKKKIYKSWRRAKTNFLDFNKIDQINHKAELVQFKKKETKKPEKKNDIEGFFFFWRGGEMSPKLDEANDEAVTVVLLNIANASNGYNWQATCNKAVINVIQHGLECTIQITFLGLL